MSRCRWIAAALCFLLAGASRAPGQTVYAAASLTTALQELMRGPGARQGLKVRFSFASSSSLVRQIAEGAPADIFFSANVRWMDYLEGKGLIAEDTRVDLLGNDLVVIAPKGEGFSVKPQKDFDFAGAFSGRLALGDPAHVPAGLYARQALERLGWWSPLEKRLAPAPDVRAALVYVERGECPAGIVYATDAVISPKVEVLAHLPSESHDPIVYPAAAVAGRETREVRRLLDFFQSLEAAQVFAKHGFTVLRNSAVRQDTGH